MPSPAHYGRLYDDLERQVTKWGGVLRLAPMEKQDWDTWGVHRDLPEPYEGEPTVHATMAMRSGMEPNLAYALASNLLLTVQLEYLKARIRQAQEAPPKKDRAKKKAKE